MNATTLKAREASIRHWERMRDGRRRIVGKRGEQELEAPFAPHCALCRRFREGGCAGCPVADSTGVSHCEGTPYDEAYGAWHRNGPDSPEFRAAAAREVKFLRGLLP